MRVASLDTQNAEARIEAYWMIVYIYLMKTMNIDISESLIETTQLDSEGTLSTSTKTSLMLKDVNVSLFKFDQGFLEFNGKKVRGILVIR